MTALLNEASAPAHCGVITLDAATFARLLHMPAGVSIDAVAYENGTARLVVSGAEDTGLLLVEPGYPIPNVQLVGRVDETGQRVVDTRILPINAEMPGYDAGIPVAPEGDD